jgi:hypothetical protein
METEKVKIPDDALSYSVYRKTVKLLLDRNTTTGNDVTQERVDYSKLNEYRMDRMDKNTVLIPELAEEIRNLQVPQIWLVLTEAWCGDSAQNIPVLAKVADASDGNVKLLLASRDANPELMDHFMTEGGRSIPKLIRSEAATGKLLGTWGPRPVPGQELMHQWKNSGGTVTKDEFHKQLHLWYARDRGATLQAELLAMLNN